MTRTHTQSLAHSPHRFGIGVRDYKLDRIGSRSYDYDMMIIPGGGRAEKRKIIRRRRERDMRMR